MSCLSVVRYAGYGEELAFGTAVAPEIFTDITGATLDAPSDPHMVYEGGLGRTRRVVRPAFYAPAGNAVQGVDIDSMVWFLRWALGSLGYGYDAGVHSVYGTDSTALPSFTARIGKDAFEHVFAGCKINTLEISADDSFASVTLDIIAQKDSKATIKAVGDVELSENQLIAFHEVRMSVRGADDPAFVDASPNVRSITLTIENGMDAARGRVIGNRFPHRLCAGARVVTLQAVMHYQNAEQLEKIWGNASGASTEGPDEFSVELTLGSVSKNIKIGLPRVIVETAPIAPTGRDEIEQTVTMQAMFAPYVAGRGVAIDVDTDIYASITGSDVPEIVEAT